MTELVTVVADLAHRRCRSETQRAGSTTLRPRWEGQPTGDESLSEFNGNGSGPDIAALLVEAAVGRPVNTLALGQMGTLLRREANALVDLAAELERSANGVEVFAAREQCRRWRAAERSRRYRARKAAQAEHAWTRWRS